jgi:hypothetical protein
MLLTGSSHIDAQRAFSRLVRARRRASLVSRLRRCAACTRLRVYDSRAVAGVGGGIREVPLDAISGTLEPSRATQFDRDFRPAPVARARWERIWLAEHHGAVLPPIIVTPVADGFAVRDGHHRVSVARARDRRRDLNRCGPGGSRT